MAWTLDTAVYAGSGNTDPAQLTASFYEHGPIGSASLPAATLTVTNDGSNKYFKHAGIGWHNFHTAAVPDGFRGIVVFDYAGTVVACASANPQEAEYVDEKVSAAKTLTAGERVTLTAAIWAAVTDSAGVTTLLARLSALRAGYLDNLNVGGLVASSAEALAIQNNTRAVRVVPPTLERPDAGSTVFRIELLLYDAVGNMEAPDSAPTLAVVNQSGTSRDANLDSTTGVLVSTGRYRWTYTIDTAHALEELVFAFSVTEGGTPRTYANGAQVVDTTAVDFTAADRTDLQTILGRIDEEVAHHADMTTLLTRVPGTVQPQTGDAFTRLGAPAGASVSADVAAAGASAAGAATQASQANTKAGAVQVVTDKIATTIEVDGLVYRFTENALEEAPGGSGGGTTVIYGEDGAIAFTYTSFDVNGTSPLEGVEVWVSADSAGVNRSASKFSDSLGRTVWNLDAGPAYFWQRRFDRTYANPDLETVNA